MEPTFGIFLEIEPPPVLMALVKCLLWYAPILMNGHYFNIHSRFNKSGYTKNVPSFFEL